MTERILIDTGPVVGLLNAADQHHEWTRTQFSLLEPPLYTCEAVLSEAQFLVQRSGGDPLAVLELLHRGTIDVDFRAAADIARLLQLQRTYRNLPMSLADACLVRMSESTLRCRVFTTDSHFRIYRRNGRQLIPLLTPPGI